MAMNDFEDHLTEHCTDIPRIISETIQLENYIFRVKEEPQRDQDHQFAFIEEAVNDLDYGMDILP